MIRLMLAGLVASLMTHTASVVFAEPHAPEPSWQTDSDRCAWQWLAGEGLALWAETCDLPSGRWEVVWNETQHAFVTTYEGKQLDIAVQVWEFPASSGIDSLIGILVLAEALQPDARCYFRLDTSLAQRAPDRTVYLLWPATEGAFSMTRDGQIPEPLCGPYGVSTHGVRYFMTDSRAPGRAVFVDEGQERPLFDPASITLMD